MQFLTGDRPTAQQLTDATTLGVLARWSRSTPSSATTSIIGVMRIDGIPVTAGVAYPIHTAGLVGASTVVNDDVEIHIRVRTGGAAATTTDPVVAGAMSRMRFASGIGSPIIPISALYVPASTTTISLLLCVTRAGGTGSVTTYADSTYVTTMWVQGAGVAPALSGVNI